MVIQKPCVIKTVWKLTDAQDQPLYETFEPTEFFFGGTDLLSAIEDALEGKHAGFQTRIQIEPEQGFGEYKSEFVCFEDRELFPLEIAVGMQFDGLPKGAKTPNMPLDAIYTVTDLYPEHVVIDANHPLAGIALRLTITITEVRSASLEERNAGSVGQPLLRILQTNTPLNSFLDHDDID